MNDSVIGIDALTLTFTGSKDLLKEPVEKRNRNNKLYMRVDRTRRSNEYIVVVILPSIIRPTNERGYSLYDKVKLEMVIDIVKQGLLEILRTDDLSSLTVKAVEVNSNRRISEKVDCNILMEFIACALLKTEEQQIRHCRGKKIKGRGTVKQPVLDGFKTDRNSSGRFYQKIYVKSRQMGLEGKMPSVVRIEHVYNVRGVKQALHRKDTVSLADVLDSHSMGLLFQRYILDVEQCFCTPVRLFLSDAVNIILEELKNGTGAYKVLLKHYDLVRYDYRIYRVALKQLYKLVGGTKQAYQVQASRIKSIAEQEGIVINEGTIREIEHFVKDIRNQRT